MHFPFRCPVCHAETAVEYADTGIHAHRCRCGLPYAVYLRQHKFETLFDFGTRALSDGYAREAAANFASALERCFEFYLRAAVLERGGGPSPEWVQALDATWKQVDRQSERQLGAFALLYLTRQGQPPDFLTPQALGSDFRNRVVHRGYIPSREEALGYAEGVFRIIERVLAELGSASVYAQREQEDRYAAHRAGLPPEVTPVFLDLPGVFRAWRFAGGPGLGLGGSTQASPGPQAPRNDARSFQARLNDTDIGQLFAKQPLPEKA